MAMDIYNLICAFFLLCFSITIVSTTFLDADAFPENLREDIDPSPQSNEDSHYDNGLTLDDIFGHKVEDESQLCPRKFILLFLITKDSQYLKACGYALGISKNKTAITPQKPLVATHSGNILKRILDNMDAGTAKIDFLDDVKGDSDKRARLSINGALSSLADLLRHESRRHRRPQFAFHREMLHMG